MGCGCRCAKYNPVGGTYICDSTGKVCPYLYPDSKTCSDNKKGD